MLGFTRSQQWTQHLNLHQVAGIAQVLIIIPLHTIQAQNPKKSSTIYVWINYHNNSSTEDLQATISGSITDKNARIFAHVEVK